MVLVHGSLAGLPEFCDIVKMIVSQEILLFIVKLQDAWCLEHYHTYDLVLTSTRELQLVEPHEIVDIYPLTQYRVSEQFPVSLKRCVKHMYEVVWV